MASLITKIFGKTNFIINKPFTRTFIGSPALCSDIKHAITFPRSNSVEVPKNEDITPISGIPEEQLTSRRVRIYIPAKHTPQSGEYGARTWKIQFDAQTRWDNPLMGWTSTADPLSNVIIDFASKDDAISYCERNGWNYHVEERNFATKKVKTYAENFAWNKRTRIGSK